jgi:uncharacterized protein YndB with AHSA1/START domain
MDIRKSYTIDAPAQAVWAALTDPEAIVGWGGDPVVMAAEPGFAFEFWGGDIHGTVIEVDPGHSILEEWYEGEWDAPSFVRFTVSSEADGTTCLELEHRSVPDDEVANIDAGWDDYYLGPIKETLEDQYR